MPIQLFGQLGKECGGNSAATLANGEMNTLDLHDWARRSGIRVHLDRIMGALRQHGAQLSDQASQSAPDQLTSLIVNKFCEQVPDSIHTVLLTGRWFATIPAAAQPVATAIEQIDPAAGVVKSAEARLSPAQTHHSPVKAHLSPAGTTQPQLAARHRASLHQNDAAPEEARLPS